MIILASQSPRRQELMKLTGLPFTVRVADVDETMDPALPVQQEVARVSRLKARTIAAGDEELYAIVGSQEANPMECRISDDSPFGKALLGHKVGDIVDVEAPIGVLKYKILTVEK